MCTPVLIHKFIVTPPSIRISLQPLPIPTQPPISSHNTSGGMRALKERLLNAESDFLEALSDCQRMEAFKASWSVLADDIEFGISRNAIDDITIALYYNTAKTIKELSQSMVEFYDDVEAIDVASRQDIQAYLEKCGPLPTSLSETPSGRRDISLAAKWLSQNFHNPYPSSDVRDTISRKANWSRKDVDAWFTEARKRIGWNEIRKNFFGNKRAETIQKATGFFHSSHTSLNPALAQAFIDMQSQVQDLYVEPFQPTKLAVVLGKSYKDETCIEASKVPETGLSTPPSFSSAFPYPSTPGSRSVSPIPTTRKRPRLATAEREEYPRKKVRQDNHTLAVQLPSPAASDPDLSGQSPNIAAEQPLVSVRPQRSTPFDTLRTSERGSSHLDTPDCSKCPSVGSSVVSQAISAPLPSMIFEGGISSKPTLDSTLENINLVSSIPRSSAGSSGLPISETTPMQELLSEAGLSEFSYDITGTLTDDQPTLTQANDVPLSNSVGSLQNFSETPYDLPVSTLLEASSQTFPPTEGVDIASLSDFLCDDQILGLFPTSFDHNAMVVPPAQVGGFQDLGANIDINLATPFFELASSSQTLPQIDDTFTDFVRGFSFPPCEDAEKAKYMAHIEMLKREKNHLQERIHFLERHILSA